MFKKDYEFGKQNEINLLCHLQKYFNDDKIELLENYSTFDYKGTNKFIELKSRNNTYSKYSSTMIGTNKIKDAAIYHNNGYDVFFIFNFTDGIYYWKYTPNNNLIKLKGGRTNRGKNEIKDYYYINIDDLIKLEI
jgi:hypothetical protein